MLFHYVKTQKRQVINIAINILIIPILLYFFRQIFKHEANFEQIYDVVEKGAIAIVVILAIVLVWLLKRKGQFEIYVTENEFYSYHPVFKEWCFSINPKDILAIEHNLSIGAGSMTNINVRLKNGKSLQICQNYSFSREGLYSALKRINPNIQFPDNANVFKHKLRR